MGFFANLFRSSPKHGGTMDMPKLAEGVQRIVSERIAILEATPSYAALRSVHFTLKAHAAVQAAVAPGERAWSRALWWGAMASEALLACARPSHFEVYFNREVTVPPAPEPAPGLAGIWREGLHMAVLAGYDEVVSSLQRFNVEWLRARDATSGEAELLYVHALQGRFSRAPDLGDRMVAAVNAVVQPDADDFVLRLLGAELECLYAIEIGDRVKLQAALTSGLEQHRTYWTAPDRASTPDGFFALGLSFVARLATAQGMAIDVRSPYLVY